MGGGAGAGGGGGGISPLTKTRTKEGEYSLVSRPTNQIGRPSPAARAALGD